jgi:putative photosynthetic complex assembly protein 2
MPAPGLSGIGVVDRADLRMGGDALLGTDRPHERDARSSKLAHVSSPGTGIRKAGVQSPERAGLAAAAAGQGRPGGFYTGTITGSRTHACVEGCSGWLHFVHAAETRLWHEIAVLIGAASVFWCVSDAMNWIGFWTYLVLLVMQNSAKPNVFLGVRNFSEQLLPAHLGFMQGFTTRKPMNLLFPVSVTVSTVALALIVEHALAEGLGPAQMAGATLLASLLALAILEHWLLMLPIPAERLWQWGHSARGKRALTDAGHDGSY